MDRPVRKEIRLKNYDYSGNGAYFITICTKDKMCLFWDNNDKYQPLMSCSNINNECVGAASRRPLKKVYLSKYGTIVKNELSQIPIIYPDIVFIPKYVIMPNHIHMIIIINYYGDKSGRRNAAPTISRVINQFKGNISRKAGFSVWQKSFYDRIIRNNAEYSAYWQYIENNPANWQDDELFSQQ